MSKKQALQFILRVKEDATLQNKLQAVRDGGAGLLKVAQEAGFEFTAEEMRTAIDSQESYNADEMANGALDSVVGGGHGDGGTGDIDALVQAVLQQAMNSTESDVSNIMKSTASINSHKSQLRHK